MLKYANTYDTTWDNVDVLKWSLIEILAACICGNLMPLRPLFERMLPPFRSAFSRYSRGSRKSSGRSSNGLRNISWFPRAGRSTRKPKLISTLHFTQMDLSPGWEGKSKYADDTISPATPATTYLEKGFDSFERPIADAPTPPVPHGMIRKTSTTVLRTNTTSQTTTTHSEGRMSTNGSDKDLVPTPRRPEQRFSGPWSRALTIFDRR